MIESAFYHNTTRIYTAAFGSIFNKIQIERQNKAGAVIDTIPVPLIYADKEKFVHRALSVSSISEETKIKETLPRMGFEFVNMDYDPMRKTNTMNRIVDHSGAPSKFSFNRVPYNFNFGLYIAARRIDDALRIVEQILPYFTPELNVRIRDMKDFPTIVSDVPIVLDASQPDISAQGNFDDRRVVLWEMQFTMKGFLYCAVRDADVIRKTIIDIKDTDLNTFYGGYMSQLDPLFVGQDDDFTIKEEITNVSSDDNGSETEV